MNDVLREESFFGKLMSRFKIHFYLFWVVLFAAQTLRYTVNQPLRPVLLGNLAELGSGALFAVIFLYVLLPRFGKKGKRIYLVLSAAAVLFVSAFICSYCDYLIVLGVGLPFERANYWPRIPGLMIYVFLMASSFGFIKIADDYFHERGRSQDLKKEKLRAELEFLKAQINPHFLFNTLNNLYFMVEKDPARAAKMILMLSDILRYQIYETDTDVTSVGKEIENIKNYIELERIRKDSININFEIKGNPETLEILPNIFLPLVENAFKHLALRKDGSCEVSIVAEKSGGGLLFGVRNTASGNGVAEPPKTTVNKGLGMTNLRRRLDLFYPGKHSLVINGNNGFYEISLSLNAD